MGLKIKLLGVESSYPASLTQAAAIVHEHAVYVVGGGSDYGHPRPPCSIPIPMDMVFRREQWSSMPAMPTPVYFAGAVKHAGLIYVIGGSDNSGPPAVRNKRKLQIYDIAARHWRLGAEPPFFVGGPCAAVVHNGTLYVLGAHQGDPYRPRCDFWSYDIARDAWTQRPGPQAGIGAHYSCVVVGATLYAINRYVGGPDFILDLGRPGDHWRSIDLNVPDRSKFVWHDGVVNFSVAAFGRFIVLVGGMRGSQSASSDIWVYDSRTQAWRM